MHRCFGKNDAFIISLVPMVTKADVSLWKILVLVLVQTAVKSTLCACVNSQGADEADANMISLCGFFFCDRLMKVDPLDSSCPCTCIIPLNNGL